MNTATFPPESRPLLAGIPPKLNVVMIYEDAEAGRRAKRFSDKLLHMIEPRCELVRNLWNFDVLAITNVRNAAAGIARVADLVIVSASGERELSPPVEGWLDLWVWLIDGTHPALVALFQNTNGCHAGGICESLRARARQKSIAFFSEPTSEPSAGLVRAGRDNVAGSSGWGSNDPRADGAGTMAAQPGPAYPGRVAGVPARRLS